MPNPQPSPSLRQRLRPWNFAGPVALGLLALTVFGWDLTSEPHFVDESAYISQAFYADLLLSGDRDNPLWLEYAGYDLPPLPKYLIGWSLRAGGYRRPTPSAAWAWYANTSRRFVSQEALVMARWPSVLLGVLGCLSIYALGTIAFDRRVGWLSGLLLMANPLYRMHARRAMSDVPAEALLLASLAVGLVAWKRMMADRSVVDVKPFYESNVFLTGLAGVLLGLATLSKLNGALAGFVLMAWAALGLALFRCWRPRLFAPFSLLPLISVALVVFVFLNPFVWAHPNGFLPARLAPIAQLDLIGRLKLVASHRVSVSNSATTQFPNDALTTPLAKIKAVAIQGFGRFSSFGPRGWTDSTRRFDLRQDWSVCVWLPLVSLGFVAVLVRGRRQVQSGQPPTAWAIGLQAGIALIVVTAFIPLAWDRYYLSIQPGSALLASFALAAGFDWLRIPKPQAAQP